MDAIFNVNWLAVVLASVANFVLGGVWFTLLFGRSYAAALGISDRPATKPAAIFLVGPFLCGAVTIATTAILIEALDVSTMPGALALGALVGFGYLGAMTTNIAINPLFPHPFRYALINVPMFVLGSLISAAILVAMR